MGRTKVPTHKHLWREIGTRSWPYVCSVCGMKSRNGLQQPPEFREPLRFTSTYYNFTTGQVSVEHWTAGEDPCAGTPPAPEQAQCEDCGAPIAAGTRFCPEPDTASCAAWTFVRSGGAALCARAAARRDDEERA